MENQLIIGEERYGLGGSVRVTTWVDHSMHFSEDNTAVRRTKDPRWIVVHWTGSEREGLDGAQLLFNSLLSRHLSVEFFIDNYGDVYQFADPSEVRCRHASRVNDISIGIEVSCVGWDKPGRRASRTTELRPKYRRNLEGWSRGPRLYDFFELQHVALERLVNCLVDTMHIPAHVELAPWGRRDRGFFSDALGGICGHLHCASLDVRRPKIDPGPGPLERLARSISDD